MKKTTHKQWRNVETTQTVNLDTSCEKNYFYKFIFKQWMNVIFKEFENPNHRMPTLSIDVNFRVSHLKCFIQDIYLWLKLNYLPFY